MGDVGYVLPISRDTRGYAPIFLTINSKTDNSTIKVTTYENFKDVKMVTNI